MEGVFVTGDWQHFENVGSLYPEGPEDVGAAVLKARQWYPVTGEEVRTTLCVTNRRRKAVNDAENKRLALGQPAVWCAYGGRDPRAQPFFCWPGLELQAGKTEGEIKNGIRFTVQSVDLFNCVLKGHAIFTMATASVAELFRPTHALTIDSSQARTLMGGVKIVETDHSFFTLRRLIVALGRSPTGACVQVE